MVHRIFLSVSIVLSLGWSEAFAESDAALPLQQVTACSERADIELDNVAGNASRFVVDLLGHDEARVAAASLIVEVSGRIADGVDASTLEFRVPTEEWNGGFAVLPPCGGGDCDENYSLVASVSKPDRLASLRVIELRTSLRHERFPTIQQVCLQAEIWGDIPSPPAPDADEQQADCSVGHGPAPTPYVGLTVLIGLALVRRRTSL